MEDAPFVSQQHLQTLEEFCQALSRVLESHVIDSEQRVKVWRDNISAVCTKCGKVIAGEDLLRLSQAVPHDPPGTELGRLRLGDCARYGCDSYCYRFAFQPHPGLSWPGLLAETEELRDASVGQASSTGYASILCNLLWKSSSTRRIGIALLVLLILLLLRHWYIGGRIPFLREPETFRVAPESVPSTNHP